MAFHVAQTAYLYTNICIHMKHFIKFTLEKSAIEANETEHGSDKFDSSTRGKRTRFK
jgi:hypothetical protein